ncbi:L-seryl-tRNA(Sec) selenium transferase [Enterococcus pallens]|uniref:L-seryl-tRNA(Sec) selenium transferase n=1 Tax=Enterococcus pallens ATCC BAA-351 TaxID=1158607 RepID=R2SC79_9ENTE|nr:L-seryl-tRNA(Sec) selenium transferase [Enterococcus pallens]EOH93135.1 L-seryl-tRNA selenium transferase [Enterococcus pallens ATCC BAA-351]EOU24921.1 L-seryl-tRNA selenium transferase [Enterococcus pallens ATCC BAA-351]OJG76463.1 L-seryl-tRNA selenium transferase [Enterococcus pallens]
MVKRIQELLAQLPAVDILLKRPAIEQLAAEYPRGAVKAAIQEVLSNIRQEVLQQVRQELPELPTFEQMITEELVQHQFSLRRVINGTGTVIHTNLGRSSLSKRVKQQIEEISFHYSNLEFDLETGSRGSRYSHLVEIIKELTGAEDVLVVNNNAAAVLLVLSTLIKDREVLVSRGELVEIGGAFRIPDVITSSGGTIVEVGTTNKTHLADYQQALTEETGGILKVHTSNYRIVGFTESVSIPALAKLAGEADIPLINDLGSGLFIDMRQFGLPYEPTVKEALDQGCDIVTFSGDKLLGGPQAGIIVGKKKYLQQMKKNQLLRALRIDKMTLSALEATFELYRDPGQAVQEIPVLHMLSLTEADCKKKAMVLAEELQKSSSSLTVTVEKDTSAVGGGSYPEHSLPTYVVSLHSEDISAEMLQQKLRTSHTPIISRIKNQKNYLDVRTIEEEEFPFITSAIKALG